ncbi:hypothetical protein [Halomonas rhizosphaerae]|uniref:Uncharacterized protein n=1 Tax=Halomonas rhizosphaerae TaxID=3043296 RepID=A0ABT6V0K8_9GAMM|nr:hypothetical protein [Halomonas rhizosphaerae]MDI5891766.1 hypothetical protein [Halomonas rhizosphaerae]
MVAAEEQPDECVPSEWRITEGHDEAAIAAAQAEREARGLDAEHGVLVGDPASQLVQARHPATGEFTAVELL